MFFSLAVSFDYGFQAAQYDTEKPGALDYGAQVMGRPVNGY